MGDGSGFGALRRDKGGFAGRSLGGCGGLRFGFVLHSVLCRFCMVITRPPGEPAASEGTSPQYIRPGRNGYWLRKKRGEAQVVVWLSGRSSNANAEGGVSTGTQNNILGYGRLQIYATVAMPGLGEVI